MEQSRRLSAVEVDMAAVQETVSVNYSTAPESEENVVETLEEDVKRKETIIKLKAVDNRDVAAKTKESTSSVTS